MGLWTMAHIYSVKAGEKRIDFRDSSQNFLVTSPAACYDSKMYRKMA